MLSDFENIIASGDFAEVERCTIAGTTTYIVICYDVTDQLRQNGAIVFSSTDIEEAGNVGWWWDNWLEDCHSIGRDHNYKRRLPD